VMRGWDGMNYTEIHGSYLIVERRVRVYAYLDTTVIYVVLRRSYTCDKIQWKRAATTGDGRRRLRVILFYRSSPRMCNNTALKHVLLQLHCSIMSNVVLRLSADKMVNEMSLCKFAQIARELVFYCSHYYYYCPRGGERGLYCFCRSFFRLWTR